MSKNQKIVLIGLASLTAVLLVVLLLFQKPKSELEWNKSFDQTKEQPFGTSFIYKMLNGYERVDQLIELTDSLKTNAKKNWNPEKGSYLFLGNFPFYSDGDIEVLVENVSAGANAFIFANNLPENFVTALYPNACFPPEDYSYNDDSGLENYWNGYERVSEKTMTFNFLADSLMVDKPFVFENRIKNRLKTNTWRCLTLNTFCENSGIDYETLGRMDYAYSNFVRIQIGEGFIYLHTNPLLFTNIHMKKEQGYEYASRVFSYLPDGNVYWDVDARYWDNNPNQSNSEYAFSDSPLSYLLSQKSMRWAWYLSLSLILLFMLFRTKRRQRAIPVLASNANTSLEFVKTIGRLYFLQNDHRKLALQKVRLFYLFIRSRYSINLNKKEEGQNIRVSAKSGLSQEKVDRLMTELAKIERVAYLSKEDLIAFHQQLEYFYQNCK